MRISPAMVNIVIGRFCLLFCDFIYTRLQVVRFSIVELIKHLCYIMWSKLQLGLHYLDIAQVTLSQAATFWCFLRCRIHTVIQEKPRGPEASRREFYLSRLKGYLTPVFRGSVSLLHCHQMRSLSGISRVFGSVWKGLHSVTTALHNFNNRDTCKKKKNILRECFFSLGKLTSE